MADAKANRRELDLAEWLFGDTPRADRHALALACYREEILAPFVQLAEDYAALQDMRVAQDLVRIIQTIRGVS